MKNALKISVVLNLLLMIVVAYLKISRHRTDTAHQLSSRVPAAQIETASLSLPVEQKPFHWSQLESTNYLTYVNNLRGIGCPAQTIRDIVEADVGQLYAKRAEQLQPTHSESDPTIEAEMKQLAAEKSAVIAYLVGADDVQQASVKAAPTSDAVTPLVWQNVDVAQLNLEPAQAEAIAELRQKFLDMIGTNQNPNSSAYLERWQKAQAYVDEQLAGAIGRKAYIEYESSAK